MMAGAFGRIPVAVCEGYIGWSRMRRAWPGLGVLVCE